MRRSVRLCAALSASLLLAGTAFAQASSAPDKADKSDKKEAAAPAVTQTPNRSVTKHSGTFNGQKVNYTAITGETFLPGPDGKPMKPELDASTPNIDTAFAAQKPGAFATDKRSAAGDRVLVTGRAFQQVPWAIAYTLNYDEALGAAEARFRNLTIVLLLAVPSISLVLVRSFACRAMSRNSTAS